MNGGTGKGEMRVPVRFVWRLGVHLPWVEYAVHYWRCGRGTLDKPNDVRVAIDVIVRGAVEIVQLGSCKHQRMYGR